MPNGFTERRTSKAVAFCALLTQLHGENTNGLVASDATPLTLFDRVRVRETPQTAALGLVGLVGQIYGETVPSAGAVEDLIIGEAAIDHAFGVHFDGREETLWFYPALLELVDHATGTIYKSGNDSWVRDAAGRWAPVDPRTAKRERDSAFERAFTTLLYGLRNADLWDLAAKLKGMLGDGSFSERNVRALASAFGPWHEEARAHVASLPGHVVTAMHDVAAYLTSRA